MENNVQPFFYIMPPHNILAEELYLGIILLSLSQKTTEKLEIKLDDGALILESHQIIYRAIIFHVNNSNFSLIQLMNHLSLKGVLNRIGGCGKVLELINQVLVFRKFSSFEIIAIYCAKIIQDKYIRRLMVQWSTYIINLSLCRAITVDIIFEQINKYLGEISCLVREKNLYYFNISSVLYSFVHKLNVNDSSKLLLSGLKCGLTQLDELTHGLQPSDLIIIAGRPGMGKTSFALNITNYILVNTNQGVILFSFEMSKKQVLYRLIAIQCKIQVSNLRSGTLSILDLDKIKENCKILTKSFLYIDDNPNITVFQLYIKVKELTTAFNISLTILDYLQLLQHSEINFNNRVQELSAITRILKILAKETLIPIIVLSQLNRNVESRTNKKPLLSDLRESGCCQGLFYWLYKYNYFKIENTHTYHVHLIYTISKLYPITNRRIYFIKKFCYGIQQIYNFSLCYKNCFYATYQHKISTTFGWKAQDSLLIFDQSIIMVNCYFSQIHYYLCIPFIKWSSCNLTYDLTTNLLLNFCYNNILIHNSIEQDADLVLLLYRKNYYINDKESNEFAEIIVAKHRNGPTGTFDIKFDAACTLFNS